MAKANMELTLDRASLKAIKDLTKTMNRIATATGDATEAFLDWEEQAEEVEVGHTWSTEHDLDGLVTSFNSVLHSTKSDDNNEKEN